MIIFLGGLQVSACPKESPQGVTIHEPRFLPLLPPDKQWGGSLSSVH